MSKSLAALRESPHTKLPEHTYELCLSQALADEVRLLEQELQDIAESTEGVDQPKGKGANPRVAEIVTRKEEIRSEMREHTGLLLLQAESAGEWRRWADANPARVESRNDRGRPVYHEIDDLYGYGQVNISALIERLGDFAKAWNAEPLQTGDWDWLYEQAPNGDLVEMAGIVVNLHSRSGVRALPKASNSLATGTSATS